MELKMYMKQEMQLELEMQIKKMCYPKMLKLVKMLENNNIIAQN